MCGNFFFSILSASIQQASVKPFWPRCLGGSRPGSQELRSENTFPIGVWADFEFETGWVSLSPGDRILLFTDGITEASNPAFAQCGESRFHDFISQSTALNASDLVENLIVDLNNFCAGTPIHDDRAVLCIDYLRD